MLPSKEEKKVPEKKEEPTKFVVVRNISVPSGRILLNLKRGEVISDPHQLKLLNQAFEGNPPIRPLNELDLY